MDIQKCNLVIRFDPIPEFRSYVQSKGRARAKPSKFVVMVDQGSILQNSISAENSNFSRISTQKQRI
jgi:endoribonuclease Dicer